VAPSVERRKVWLTPTARVPCSNAAKTRNPLKFAEMPQTRQQISAVSRPKFTILSGHVEEVLLFNKFFPIVDTCRRCEDTARQSCEMVPKWRFLRPVFLRAACSTFQTGILYSHQGHTMYAGMVDIQSATAEIRRGKKDRKNMGKNIMSASATQGGHNKPNYYKGRLNRREYLYHKVSNSIYLCLFAAHFSF